MQFFMKSMKNTALHGSMAKPSLNLCSEWKIYGSAWLARRMQLFMESSKNEIVHQICEERSSRRKPKALQLVTKPIRSAILHGIHEEYNSSWVLKKAILDEILPCRKQFCVKPTQKIMKSTKNAILHKFRDTCCSSWNPVSIQLFTKHTKSELFMKSMKNPIPHESPKQCNSSWNPWRIQFFMKSFRKATFHDTNGGCRRNSS